MLVDDLMTWHPGTYRMFTSVRHIATCLKTTPLGLTEKGRELGWWMTFAGPVLQETREFELKSTPEKHWVSTGTEQGDAIARNSVRTDHEYNLSISDRRKPLRRLVEVTVMARRAQVGNIEIKTKYAGYIDRQQAEIARLRASENTKLPVDIDYTGISGLSKEIQSKLGITRPETLGQASRIPGVTPAAISLLMIHLKKRGAGRQLEQSA